MPALAEELYQDVWIKVVNARTGYEPLARFSTWIFRIARNRLIDHYRKHAPLLAASFAPQAIDDDPDALDDLIDSLPAPLHETPHALLERRTKVDPYLRPLYDALYDLMGFDRVAKAVREGADRDRAAGLHARPHAEPRLRDPR